MKSRIIQIFYHNIMIKYFSIISDDLFYSTSFTFPLMEK
jgi:hypothetical protein